MPLPSPAPFSTRTTWPWRRSWRTPAGVIPTRYSRVLVSFGTPMIMEASAPGGGFERDPQERRHLRGIAFFYFSKQSQCVQNRNLGGSARGVELRAVAGVEPHDRADGRQRERPERRESTDHRQPHHPEL